MDITKVQEGMKITYTGDSFAYGGDYRVISAESTYRNADDCPKHEKGKLMIIEFTNSGTPMFFTLDRLNPDEWEIK